jgi:hypothetical protein
MAQHSYREQYRQDLVADSDTQFFLQKGCVFASGPSINQSLVLSSAAVPKEALAAREARDGRDCHITLLSMK